MIILAIDPGFGKSAWLLFNSNKMQIEFAAIFSNAQIIESLSRTKPKTGFDILAIEIINNTFSRTRYIGPEIMMTQFWAGRFYQAVNNNNIETFYYHRKQIVTTICGNPTANDSDIRQALIGRFPATGAGKRPQIGTKKKPGPLYGIHKDLWSALAVAVTHMELFCRQAF